MTNADSSSVEADTRGSEDRAVERIARWSPSARTTWIVVVVASLVAFLPAIFAPLQLDDYLHASMARGTYPAPRGPTELYDFVTDRDRATLLDRGVLPWWSHPHLTIRFFRPLSSAILWASHRMLHGHVLAMHLLSLAWWALAVVATRRLFSASFSPRVAAIATFVFAVAPAHALPLAWLANFEVLVSIAFGAFALGAYARFRARRSPRDALLAALGFALSLAGGEYGLCFGGYVVAIEIVRRDRIRSRVSGLVPFVAPTLAYLAIRARLGCGAIGSGFYADPLREPWGFLAKAPWRLVALIDDAWLSFGAETWSRGTPRWLAWVLLVAGVVALAGPVRRAIASLEPAARESASWLLIGSMLAMAPLLAVKPSPRVLGASAIGVAAIVAIVIDRAWFPNTLGKRRGRAERTIVVATVLGFLHLLHAPIASFAQGLEARRAGRDFATHLAALAAAVPADRRQEVVVVRGLAEMFFAPFALDPDGRFPHRWRSLSQTGHVLLKRDDDRTLELMVGPEDCLTWSGPDDLFRAESSPVRAGDRVDLPGMRVQVLAANAHGATHVRYVFDAPLEEAAQSWIHEQLTGFERIDRLPKPGFAFPLEP